LKSEKEIEQEIDRLQKVMAEQDKQFEKLGKKPNEVEYDDKGRIVVDINDKRQMKLWNIDGKRIEAD
jgi:DNA-binding transcriptional regulator/RsmH inhibitor MraZ